MKPVTLEPAELAMCRMMGNLRTHASRIAHSRQKDPSGNKPEGFDENGFIGEYAFCKQNNLFFDITAMPRNGGYDCIYLGQRIDVKTTEYVNGKLMVLDIGNEDVDVYVLAILDGDTVLFPGYCTANRLKKDGQRMVNNDGSYRYEMTQDQLTKWKSVNKSVDI